MPGAKTDTALVAAAPTFVAEAEKVKDTLVSLNLPLSIIDELGRAADAFEQASRETVVGRSGQQAARAGITAAIEEGLNAVRILDVVVTNAVKSDPKPFAAWAGDRKVDQRARTAATAPEPAVAPAPVTPSAPDAPPVAPVLPKAS